MTGLRAGELRKLLLDSLKQPMADLGLTKRAEGAFTYEANPEVLAACQILVAFHNRVEAGVGVAVGLRHQVVERLVAECAEKPFRRYDLGSPTFNLEVLRQAGEKHNELWEINIVDLTSVDRVIHDAILPMVRDGFVPWADGFQTVEAVRDRMLPAATEFTGLQSVVEPLSVAQWMLGDPDAAEALLVAYLGMVKEGARYFYNYEGMLAAFTTFADNLRARMDAGPYEPPAKSGKP